MAYPLVIVSLLFVGYWFFVRYSKQKRQRDFIDRYTFPRKITEVLKAHHPHLNDAEIELVYQGLRDYFHVCNREGKKMVSMPSQVVDDAWHEFILFTRKYDSFCEKALGRFLHHTPAEAMTSPTLAQEGIKRAWFHACVKEGVDPKNPTVLPLLFSIDSLLNIENGFHYSLDCRQTGSGYCAGSIGCSGSGCGGSSDSSGCGGGCGGS